MEQRVTTSARIETTINHAAYLDRIGYDGPRTPDAETLRRIVQAHLYTVPFENLDIVPLGRPIQLEPDALFDKIVGRRRGGFCYEVNGLFAQLLRQLGYDVTIVTAQWPAEGGGLSPIFDHMVLLVRCPGESGHWLVDVAAGRSSTTRPLRLEVDVHQFLPELGGIYRFSETGHYLRLESLGPEGEWTHVYSFTQIPREPADFFDRCNYHQTNPDSHFTQAALCSMATPNGRITISKNQLITTINGESQKREESEIRDDAEFHHLLQTHFGIDLDA
jgi:N-hydroxyarylamine O-acetyltransferase